MIKMAAVVDSKDENENNETEVLLKADDYNYYNLDTTAENDMFNPRTRLQIQTDRESTISDTDSALLLADPEVDTINTDPDGREISTNHKNWHCHAPLPGEDKTARNQLIGVSVLCFAFMIAELAGGLIAHSLAIATDATHLACDLAGFLVSLFAIWLAKKPPTKRMSFGWFRAEVVGALVSILIIWVVTAVLIYVAILRIHHHEYDVVEERPMLITASLGVIFNILMGIILHSGLCKGCRIKSSFGHGHSHGGGGHGHSHGGDHEHSHGEGGHSHSGGSGHSHGSDGHSHDGAGHSHGGHSHDDHTHTCSKYHNTHDKQSRDTHRHSSANTAGVSSGADDLLDVAKPIVIVSDGDVQSSQAAAGSSPLFLNSTHDSYSLPTLERRDESNIFDENIVVSDQDDVALLDDTFQRASNRVNITHVASMESTRRKQNINVRAAFIHVVGDLVQSIGVLVAAIIISFRPDLKIADPICTFIFSFLVLCTTISVLRDILLVIMEGVPRDADFDAIKADLSSLPGVHSVHSLNVWALTLDKLSVCVHLAVVVPPNKWEAILVSGTDLLRTKYDVHQSTIQIEMYNEEMTTACQRC